MLDLGWKDYKGTIINTLKILKEFTNMQTEDFNREKLLRRTKCNSKCKPTIPVLNGFNSRLRECNKLEDRLMEIKAHWGGKN